MDTLISLKRHKYDGVWNNPGDIFMAKPKYAKVLCKIKMAKPYKEPKEAKDPEPVTPEVKVPEPVAQTAEVAIVASEPAAEVTETEVAEEKTEAEPAPDQEPEAPDADPEPVKPAPRRRGRPPGGQSTRRAYNRKDMVADKD